MSCKNLILISLLLAILVLCGGAVSASQDNITTDELAVNEDIDIETSDDSASEDLKDELNENILENTNDNDNLKVMLISMLSEQKLEYGNGIMMIQQKLFLTLMKQISLNH